eukprot:Plantae.Rhodophyta-Purpureofilum_apyrenoidigerum.ctg21448.p2 GENE.Plantae.Rhodophyta-Purpureofilum_apyrenoidigerum.ctg21448~~Plantae.Rhodophyta-Purpureofilum_apyrenoidigerum.ctg21448.p2  ORF type:complete len:210 (-),score=71.16 Plantae.Rhodophyta-Purpureofilum_apyrenoidigerum.ctg21448:341-970(-)
MGFESFGFEDVESYRTAVPVITMVTSFVVFSVYYLVTRMESRASSYIDELGRKYKLVEVPGDGNCGFHAIAVGMNALRKQAESLVVDEEFGESDVRKLLKDEATAEPKFYLDKLAEFGFDESELDRFIEAAQDGGMDGHWLGARLGEVELMMLAKALNLRINVFISDDEEEEIKCYQTHDFGKDQLGLLYTGSHDQGHFDLLVEVTEEA